jgi:hypothetical protein
MQTEDPQDIRDSSRFRTIEPLLAGDRQREKHVAKAHNPLQRRSFEVSLS